MNSLGTDFEQSFLHHKKSGEEKEERHNLFKMGPTWVAAAPFIDLPDLFFVHMAHADNFLRSRGCRKNRMLPTKKPYRITNVTLSEPFQLENWPKIVLDNHAWLLFIDFLFGTVNAFCLSRKAITTGCPSLVCQSGQKAWQIGASRICKCVTCIIYWQPEMLT